MAAHTRWASYRTDTGLHAVYWVAEWPAIPVEAAWCYPLLALSGVRRTISVSAEPIAPSKSLRELRSARVAKRADEAQRRRLGQIETAADDEEAAALQRREQELVRGHTEYRFTGWIKQPAEIGPVLFSNTSPTYARLAPIAASSDGGGGGMSTGAIIGIAAAALILLGGAAFWFMRRRTVEERE